MNYKHGLYGTRFHRIFKSMKQRTGNPNSTGWKTYGAKGIRCLWKTFDEFRLDMYASYVRHAKKHGELNTTIERISNKGHYCKTNCKWATWAEQLKHRTCVNRYTVHKLT